ncbi:MAG TPA: proton-conducting transporter membrane subunit [Nitrospirales bacterium]|nr:proton-conducting transporter membrane subunit [Nitrospira sp. MA-1]HNP59320.1 proton-conducting transporter membrane subunit [Nitrospirales bacterium]
MTRHLPVILFLLPLGLAICLPLIGVRRREWCRPLAIGVLAAMVPVSFASLAGVLQNGTIHYDFGGWAAPVGIEWVADGLASIMTVALSLVGLVCITFLSSVLFPYLGSRIVPFYTLVLLLIASLIGMVFAGDLFNLFVFLEVSALCAYALVGLAGGKALVAGFRYLILGTFGASLYLLGVGYLYAETGTLNMADLAQRVPPLVGSKAIAVGVLFMFIGLGIKMALVPLHGWLPDAYTYAPDRVSPMLASLVTKVALYGWIRIMFWVLGAHAVVYRIPVLFLVGVLGALAALVGAFLALSQTEIKRMFAYGGLSHIGLILVGISLGNQTGFVGGVFYLLNDAVMQAGLFFWAGAIIHLYGVRTIEDLGRLQGGAGWMSVALVVIALSMIGIPPTGGFFGKWYIILGAVEAQNYLAIVAVLIATLLTLAYFAKLFERLFRDRSAQQPLPIREIPLAVRIGLGATSVGVIVLGVMSDHIVSFLLKNALPPGL